VIDAAADARRLNSTLHNATGAFPDIARILTVTAHFHLSERVRRASLLVVATGGPWHYGAFAGIAHGQNVRDFLECLSNLRPASFDATSRLAEHCSARCVVRDSLEALNGCTRESSTSGSIHGSMPPA
jgi:hypothetical protein